MPTELIVFAAVALLMIASVVLRQRQTTAWNTAARTLGLRRTTSGLGIVKRPGLAGEIDGFPIDVEVVPDASGDGFANGSTRYVVRHLTSLPAFELRRRNRMTRVRQFVGGGSPSTGDESFDDVVELVSGAAAARRVLSEPVRAAVVIAFEDQRSASLNHEEIVVETVHIPHSAEEITTTIRRMVALAHALRAD